MSYRYQTATVFGGAGFIGRHVIRRLAKTGMTVRVPTRNPVRAQFLRPNGVVGQVVPFRCRLSDDGAIASAVAGSDLVINLVGILYETGSQKFDDVHGKLPGRIAAAAAAAGVRQVVHVSAIGADPASPSHYARSKAEGEASLRSAFPESAVLRPSIVFGPEDGFFNLFAGLARMSPFLPLIGGGTNKMQPVYVGDVAAAVMAAAESVDARGKTFELGGPRAYTMRALMELILKETGRSPRLMTVPFWAASLKAGVLERLPGPKLLTRDQVELLKLDNVVGEGAATLEDLGIAPTAVEVILPTYLDRFRRGGRFSTIRQA